MTLAIIGAPVGLAIGLAAWLVAGGASASDDKLSAAAERLGGLRVPAARAAIPPGVSVADLQTTPIFALTVGPGAVKDPAVRLDGISISARRTAALISVDGKPAEWFVAGETREGVTLQQVLRSHVVVETVLGDREVDLGDSAASTSSPPPPPAAPDRDDTPRGFRAPPPPASAPR